MKKRKFFSYLFLGLLAVGATGTVTSCKDYDDDINENKASIQSLQSALAQCKTDCETARNTLQSQLEAKDAELATLVQQAQSTADGNTTAIADQVKKEAADVAALEARIKTCEDAISEINSLLTGKVSKEDYDKVVTDVYGKLETVQTDLGKALTRVETLETNYANLKQGLEDETALRVAAANNLQTQIDALKLYEARIKALEDKIPSLATSVEVTEKIADLKKTLENEITSLNISSISGLQEALAAKADASTVYTKDEIKSQLTSLSTDISKKISDNINVLTVLLDQSLRSLVFIPDAYYYGVEATKIQLLDYWKFNVQSTTYKDTEKKGYSSHERYESTAASRVLTFVANYHMNPSSAKLPENAKVSVLTDDKEFVRAAAASAPFTVKSYSAVGGDLSVNIDIADPTKIKNVPDNSALTVFAVQVNTNTTGADTTVTSDYATIYKESIKNLKIHHAAGNGVTWAYNTVANTHDASIAVKNHNDHKVLWQTAFEARTNPSQDTVLWDGSLDLSKLVEVHYTTADGKNAVMDAKTLAANGLSFKFELTGLFMGSDTKTSESAHAAINSEDGVTLRPQMVNEADGSQQAYGSKQDRQTIGRTPLVRVELVDANNNVLDYGYIRVRIAEQGKETPTTKDLYHEYTGDGWTYVNNGECVDPATEWKFENSWYQTEYDLYNQFYNLTREQFESIYTAEKDGTTGKLVQYKLNTTTGKFSKLNAADEYGDLYELNDGDPEKPATSQKLYWYISPAKMKQYFVDEAKKTKKAGVEEVSVAMRYVSNNADYRDLYVLIHTGKPITVTYNDPAGVADIVSNIIPEYWYTTNTAKAGTNEIHANTLTPEDNVGGTAKDLDDLFSDVFKGNKIAASTFIPTITDLTKNKEYAASKLALDLVFAETQGTFKGNYRGTVREFVLTTGDNGKGLYANIKGQTAKEKIALITSGDVEQQQVELIHSSDNNGYAEALLNYAAHDALADDVLTAVIALTAKQKDNCKNPLPLTNNTFNVRFLRPLNVFEDNTKKVEDAANKLQELDLVDFLTFTDWRDLWNGAATADKGGTYATYYGIKNITVDGVTAGQNLSRNPEVKTNLGQASTSTFVSLNAVSAQLEMSLSSDGQKIVYKNLSSTVRDFDVRVPIAVEYVWGKIYKVVTIHVVKSLNNAKRH